MLHRCSAAWLALHSPATRSRKPKRDDLAIASDLLTAGKITPFIDRRYPLSEVPAAIRHLEQRQVRGKVAITVV